MRGDSTLPTVSIPAERGIEEAALVAAISGALDEYARENDQMWRGEENLLPANAAQSADRWDAFCFDLARRIDRCHLLLLEVKHQPRRSGRLPSFRKSQHECLLRLAAAKVPILYAYNSIDQFANTDDRLAALRATNVAEPERLYAARTEPVSPLVLADGIHEPLFALIERLLKPDGAPARASLLALLFDEQFGRILAHLRTAFLVFLYNVDEGTVHLVDLAGKNPDAFVQGFNRYVEAHPDASKDVPKFVEAVRQYTADVRQELAAVDADLQTGVLQSELPPPPHPRSVSHDDRSEARTPPSSTGAAEPPARPPVGPTSASPTLHRPAGRRPGGRSR